MVTALIVYVDDIIVTTNHQSEVSRLNNFLRSEFEVKDLSQL